jgi:hypothetical protein
VSSAYNGLRRSVVPRVQRRGWLRSLLVAVSGFISATIPVSASDQFLYNLEAAFSQQRELENGEILDNFVTPIGADRTLSSETLLRGLMNASAVARGYAAFHIGELETPTPRLVRALFLATRDRDPSVAAHAIGSLRRIGQTNGHLILDLYVVRAFRTVGLAI